ncbi:MAG: class I SAM-dependent methyltransferase, partial [Candidatus Thermoplasmatota archaeon]|nr:class I SAM-dependent methyltransferase [Candidatus Thermoplasmatota archaeon]
MSDAYTVEDGAKAATRMIRNGVPQDEIRSLLATELSADGANQALTFAKLRETAASRFEDPWDLWFDEQGLRYATPDVVARARADRLSAFGDSVCDVACGVGIQLAFLGQVFEEAHGIELDPDRAQLAEKNVATLKAGAQVHVGDCLDPDMREEIGHADVVFCDPARDAQADKRIFDDLSPDPRKVLETWTQGTQAWCLELPPMMPPERVHEQIQGELVYTSLNGDLNRLAVYGGEAAEVE